jgi:hypothetical protein
MSRYFRSQMFEIVDRHTIVASRFLVRSEVVPAFSTDSSYRCLLHVSTSARACEICCIQRRVRRCLIDLHVTHIFGPAIIFDLYNFSALRPVLWLKSILTMTDPISLASGLMALATFSLQASKTLYDAVNSFRSHSTRVRELQGELYALLEVLSSLNEQIRSTTSIDLSNLNMPLLQCARACTTFQEELVRCSSRSGVDRTSFRDWAKLRYMGDDIDGFRRLLAGYKSTINVALTSATL